jgi:hypothetical protein
MTEPLLYLIQEYRNEFQKFLDHEVDEGAPTAWSDLDALLAKWKAPATSRREAQAALQLALESYEAGETPVIGAMLAAAHGYFLPQTQQSPIAPVSHLAREIVDLMLARPDAGIERVTTDRHGVYIMQLIDDALLPLSDVGSAIAAYHAAEGAWRPHELADETVETKALFQAKESADNAVVRAPCRSLEDVRAKARLALSDENFMDSLENCTWGDERILRQFLRSILGEDA